VTGSTDSDPVIICILNITSNNFEISPQEPSNTDGVHAKVEVSYVVIEKGYYSLVDGTRIVADYSNSSATADWLLRDKLFFP
jgi:hypothetical protein